MPYFAFVSKGTSLLQLVLLVAFLLITLSFGEETSDFGGNLNFGANANENLETTVISVSLASELGSESATSATVKRWVPRPARSLPTAQVVVPSNGNGVYSDSDTLENLFTQLEILRPCNRVLNSSLVKRLISESQQSREVQRNLSSVHSFLSQLVSTPVYLANAIELEKSLPRNSSFTSTPAVFPNSRVDPSPAYGLQLQCDEFTRHWVPVAVYPTKLANSFLQVPLAEARLDACGLTANQCSSKCSYTVIHRQLRIWARSCSGCEDNNSLDRRFCREDLRSFHRIFYAISVLFAMASVLMIVLVIRERHRQQQEARGWALMEPFFLGAALLYIIPLLDWYSAEAERSSCCIVSWLRAFGFTLFYGSVLLKIYRNLQEYRVRKAYHVIVREHDLIKILVLVLLFTFIALAVWTVSSSNDREIWENSWPQCPMGRFEFMWAGCELTILLYGMRLCYKARSSSWVERWQFTLAVCLEAVVTLSINLVRYSLNNTGSNDALFIATIIQIHLTISINIGAIITPKFLVSSESSRRTLTISGGGIGNSGRAHPSLAKLRDNLINGTVDFAEIPIVDMNPEDIRAELKRVYTQLRMYKLKNLYQDNPHISKRKGGGKKPEKTGKNRRISIPPASSSPKVRRVDELEDEKSDLTVESAPHNIYLSTNKIQLEANDQSVRV
ncbi:7 transmembrane sweet-taste receptor of 3 GCPR domain-containing protein [Ditylenchus destructor]|uniref:7 transmembrane sweet-taste receptor of 3 GCPR domain-containing protein n=1 Tax=Ditylenchus destructor TaxID=166010 RepID=A0AAD4N649_9BILA|nr:7 transmembrane sweet-taste receptor of 3 GCPR domain-containing protein [Ditylenchus destructor]